MDETHVDRYGNASKSDNMYFLYSRQNKKSFHYTPCHNYTYSWQSLHNVIYMAFMNNMKLKSLNKNK